MTRATVVDSEAGLGQTLRTGRLLIDGLSFHGVSGLCMGSLAHRLPGGIHASRVYQTPRPMQAWSLALGVGQLPVVHTPWVAISVVSSVAPNLKHGTTIIMTIFIADFFRANTLKPSRST